MLLEPPPGCGLDEDVAGAIRDIIKPRFAEISRFRSTPEFHGSTLYRELAPAISRALDTAQTGGFPGETAPAKTKYRIIAWNLERGKQLAGQIEVFRQHDYLQTGDVYLLTETDLGMARSGNHDVAQTLARELGMYYAFVPCYLSLVKGSGTERDVEGENTLGLHGNAILSRYPLKNVTRIRLQNGIDKLASNEKRLGSQTALWATVEFPNGALPVASIHLDANSTQRHRADQMRDVLRATPATGPLLLGGDWNTTTFDSSSAFRAIMGYWLRVFMGPNNVIRNHFLRPDHWFERELFETLRKAGFDYDRSNVPLGHTISYDVTNIHAHKGLAEWVPGWCFPFIRWALRRHGGVCPVKIDWFASRELDCENPVVIHDVREGREVPLSDHDAIGVDVRFPPQSRL